MGLGRLFNTCNQHGLKANNGNQRSSFGHVFGSCRFTLWPTRMILNAPFSWTLPIWGRSCFIIGCYWKNWLVVPQCPPFFRLQLYRLPPQPPVDAPGGLGSPCRVLRKACVRRRAELGTATGRRPGGPNAWAKKGGNSPWIKKNGEGPL